MEISSVERVDRLYLLFFIGGFRWPLSAYEVLCCTLSEMFCACMYMVINYVRNYSNKLLLNSKRIGIVNGPERVLC